MLFRSVPSHDSFLGSFGTDSPKTGGLGLRHRLEVMFFDHGRVAVANANGSELDDLSRARRQLFGIDVSLEQAVKEYAECYRALGGRSVSGFVQGQPQRVGKLKEGILAEVAAELIAEKEARGKGKSWVKSLRVFNFITITLSSLLKAPPQLPIPAIPKLRSAVMVRKYSFSPLNHVHCKTSF